MNENFDELESELSRLRPRRLPPGMSERIATKLDEPSRLTLSDRVLMMFMGSGALAAMVIVGLLSWQILDARSPASAPTPLAVQHPPASIGQYQQALARSDGAALELLR